LLAFFKYICVFFVTADFCDFEKGLCNWSQLPNDVDDFDWIQGGGSTRTLNTGPSNDHTRGNRLG